MYGFIIDFYILMDKLLPGMVTASHENVSTPLGIDFACGPGCGHHWVMKALEGVETIKSIGFLQGKRLGLSLDRITVQLLQRCISEATAHLFQSLAIQLWRAIA